MQPFGAVEKIKESYQRYVKTSFPLANKTLERNFDHLVREEHLLWQEPFVSLSRTFKRGGTLEDLVRQGILGHEMIQSSSLYAPKWSFSYLYHHQRQAIERLSSLHQQPKNTLIATGTGSGKTEAFLIPIIDHCQRHSVPGIQAVIVYPMNALVNDQLKRLRELLRGTGVTFGRYTGDTKPAPNSTGDYDDFSDIEENLPDEERPTRKDIRQSPPQILLTNYSMLEYLLVRKKDRQMFLETLPRYLVLDEVHTYVGNLGSEVACLIRRFKEHAGLTQGQLCCVGTSATLISSSSPNPDHDLLAFATSLFGENFTDRQQSIIKESYEPIPSISESAQLGPNPDLSDDFLKDIDIENSDDVCRLASRLHIFLDPHLHGEDVFKALYVASWEHPVFTMFEEQLKEPRSIEELVNWLEAREERAGVSKECLKLEITAVLLLGSAAYGYNKQTGEDEPRYRPKVHLCTRSMTPLTMTLHLTNGVGDLLSEGKTEYEKKENTNGASVHLSSSEGKDERGGSQAALPLAICRSCGNHYLKGYYEQDEESLLEMASNTKRSSNGRRRRRLNEKAVERLPESLKLTANQPQGLFQEIYVHLLPIEDIDKLDIDEEGDVPDGEDTELSEGIKESRMYLVCPHCLVAHDKDTVSNQAQFQHDRENCPGSKENLPTFFGFGKGVKCPICKAQGHGVRDIITLMRSGAAVSVSILTESLLPQLKAADDGTIGEKKLLIFADSRQDTAHQAGYLRDRHQTFTQRQLAYKTIEQYENQENMAVPLDRLSHEVFVYSQNEWHSEADALNLLALDTYKSKQASGLLKPDEVISNAVRKHARERLEWDMYTEFTERSDTRNSLEREGLVMLQYAQLEEVARENIDKFAEFGFTSRRADIDFLVSVLQVIMDYMRRKKAVDYKPFRNYQSAGSLDVLGGIARPTKYNRTPNGFHEEKEQKSRAYSVIGWYNKKAPNQYRTAIYDAVYRMLDKPPEEKVTKCIRRIVELLAHKGYIRKVKIGQLSGGNANLVKEAYQLVPKNLEVSTKGSRYRCERCGDVRSYRVLHWGTHADATPVTICANYKCGGKTVAYIPRVQNFYVQYYRDSKPERLYAAEHSGQLSGKERVDIEKDFKEGRVNVLVCTPTLELGVDIGDLPSIILRNMPPTPSNYAQRSGRPGRRRRIALILPHAGQGPHDTYFFYHLEEMIKGAISPPIFLMNNEVVIKRHLNSLIMEKLKIQLPPRWREENDARDSHEDEDEDQDSYGDQRVPKELVSEEGFLQTEWLDAFRREIDQRRHEIVESVKRAFLRDRQNVSGDARNDLSWLNATYIEKRCDDFISDMEDGLKRWCVRYREIYNELLRMNRRVLLSRIEERRQGQLREALRRLMRDRDYRPLNFLTSVGFLPRYGFAGNMVTIYDDDERHVSQVASVGVTEYALGNVVYVAGKKLQINRVHFAGGSKADPLENAHSYKYCLTCNYTTEQQTAQECPYCKEFLVSGQNIAYEMAHGWGSESITQNDEYRSHQDYDLKTYLNPLSEETMRENGKQSTYRSKTVGGWQVNYSHLREITLFNRGKIDSKTGKKVPFTICLECGAWIRPISIDEEEAERAGFRASGTDHLYSCSARTDAESPYVKRVDLKVQVQGDVIEIDIPYEVSKKKDYFGKWVATLQEALKLGLQLELFIKPGEIASFVATYKQDGLERKKLVLYDTMPGGTGYLQRFYDYLPSIAQRVLTYLQKEKCETACYSCLKEFWNQRIHGLLDKRLVYEVLVELASVEKSSISLGIVVS